MLLRDLPVFYLDMQTTGSHPKSAEVLEVAWCRYPHVESYFVKQDSGYIPYHIQKLTGICNSDLDSALDRQILIEKLKQNENIPCIIHYAQFEIPFLQNWFQNQIPFPVLCTHDIAKRLFPNLPTRSLKGLAGFFGHQKEDIKRAQSHVEATGVIWQGLIPELNSRGILTWDDLILWLSVDFKKKKAKYEYPLEKEKRLNLSKNPGIYRMLNRSGEVLYVGKATSLHSRVNSYFRGQKNRDVKKLEMLTQVWDLQITECRSPLEAALLEADEIKKLDPPYNICLKTNARKLTFFSKDFLTYSHQQDDTHSVGPFSHWMVLDSVRNLSFSVKQGRFSENIFFDPFPSELLEQGFNLFCSHHQVDEMKFKNIRSTLAMGLLLYRKSKFLTETLEEEISTTVTPEEMAKKFERHFIRAGLAYLRSRSLTKLLNSAVEYPLTKNKVHTLYFVEGQMVEKDSYQKKKNLKNPWNQLTVDDYDRMSVLHSEVQKLKKNSYDQET